MTKCTIKHGGLPVIDWSKGQPRIFDTKEDAESWAKLSCYSGYTIVPVNQKEDNREGGRSRKDR